MEISRLTATDLYLPYASKPTYKDANILLCKRNYMEQPQN